MSAYVPFGSVNKSTGAAYTDKHITGAAHTSSLTSQTKVLDASLNNIDLQYNQAVLSNKGIDDGSFSEAAYNAVQSLAGNPSYASEPTFQNKILPYMDKYAKLQTTTKYGNPSTNQKNAWIQQSITDFEAAKDANGFISPEDAQIAVDNWLKANPLNKASQIVPYMKPYLDPNNNNYPAIIRTPKKRTLLQNVGSGIGNFFVSLYKGIKGENQ